MSVPEQDWKTFKRLRPLALDRLCQRTLDEAQALIQDSSLTAHQRYLALYALIERRDRQIAQAFNRFSRSSACLALTYMRSFQLLEDHEVAEFSAEMQAASRVG